MITKNNSTNIIKLKHITKQDHKFLFDLLNERPFSVNISHRSMPSYKQHIHFVNSKPYSYWYIIMTNGKKIGSVYLSKMNEIGIFLKKEYRGNDIGHKAIDLLMTKHPRKRYLANISPKNKKSKLFFKNQGFQLIQYTYEKVI
tara:strand:- start:729 stop:1157 length:429 start_codon:yes stop_codon:yes gene_type:complete